MKISLFLFVELDTWNLDSSIVRPARNITPVDCYLIWQSNIYKWHYIIGKMKISFFLFVELDTWNLDSSIGRLACNVMTVDFYLTWQSNVLKWHYIIGKTKISLCIKFLFVELDTWSLDSSIVRPARNIYNSWFLPNLTI